MKYVDKAETSRIGMWGVSRGGMMTYIVLTKTKQIKAAVVLSGLVDLGLSLETRTDMDTFFYAWVPAYRHDKNKFIKERSAIELADQICKTTPFFIIQGTTDWRVRSPNCLGPVD